MVDLLDMGRRGKPYNKQFWYLLTALNTNSRFVYAVPIKKGADEKVGERRAQRRELKSLSNDEKPDPRWIDTQIIPAMRKIMQQIETDIKQDDDKDEHKRIGLHHRRVKSVMVDGGAEFQLAFREWLASIDIATMVNAPETHEEISRLNSFHRYFRARYQTQWRKYFENPRNYGGPVRWINPKADRDGFSKEEADEALVESPEDAAHLAPLPASAGGADDDDWAQPYTTEEQKLAISSGMWKITYWQEWINSHNTTVKANSLRGAEVADSVDGRRQLSVRVPKSPAEISDAMVRNLVRFDAAEAKNRQRPCRPLDQV